MLKVNDVKTKRGVDLAEHLVGYYQAQEKYCMQRCSLNLLRLLGFTGIYWNLLGFTGIYWNLLGFIGITDFPSI